jgi:O-antigen/teichoic acid export membrane protein
MVQVPNDESMSLKKNIIANYTSQLYMIAVGILTLPMLVEYMGAEAYGLVGFFTLTQSWLSMLDMGMSATMSREVSRYRGGALPGSDMLNIFKTLRSFFLLLGVLFIIVFAASTDYLSTSWLKTESLDHSLVVYSLVTIAFIVAARWFSGFYRATVTGFEQLIWLSGYNALIATLRFVAVFLVFYFVDASPVTFFTYQLFVAVAEVAGLAFYVKGLLPRPGETTGSMNRSILRNALKFSLTIAFTSAVWVAVTQTDKLILSKLLKLSDFGYFTLAVQLAGGIILVTGPISSAIIPRLVKMEAEQRHDELIRLYRQATQLVMVVVGAIALTLIFFPKQVLFVWTGDPEMTEKVAPFLVLYAIGNFLLSASAFAYHLQYAKGNLKFHVYGNIGFLVLLIPTLIYVVNHYGGVGAGYVWASMNVVYFLCWIPFVHNYFDKTLNRGWYFQDIFRIVLPGIAVALLAGLVLPHTTNRIWIIVELGCIVSLLLAVMAYFSTNVKAILGARIQAFKGNKGK